MAKKDQSGGRRRGKRLGLPTGFVSFNFQDSTYQIDLERRKVYKSWVEVHRSKELAVISAFRAASPAASL